MWPNRCQIQFTSVFIYLCIVLTIHLLSHLSFHFNYLFIYQFTFIQFVEIHLGEMQIETNT